MEGRSPRILVLRGGAIGDFVLTLPVLQSLMERWPDATIELVGYPHIAALALAGGLVQEVHALEQKGLHRLFGLRADIDDDLVAFFRSFDVVISYLHDPDQIVSTNLEQIGVKQLLYGSPLVDEGHAIDHLLKPLESLAIYPQSAQPRMELVGEHVAFGKEWLEKHASGRAVALHPGSGSAKKNWPVQRFCDLSSEIDRRGLGKPFFILGEADHALVSALANEAADVPVLTGCNLVELASVLAACDVYVGNDSGVTHLAAATGCRVLALFGPSDAGRWGPRGGHVQLIEAPGGDLSKVAVEAVLSAFA